MSAESVFSVVAIMSGALPCAIAFLVVHFSPWPKHVLLRSVVGVVAGWVLLVFYTIVAYNPAGIAAATEQGVDSPAMRYDNNTTASAVFGGWILPAVFITIYFVARRLRKRKQEA